MTDMLAWWNSLGLASQIFYCMAIPATLVLLIQTFLMFLGMEGDGEVGDMADGTPDDIPDVDGPDGVFEGDGMSEDLDPSGFDGLRVFTVRGIIAFFVVFGWVGVVMDGAGVALPITLAVSTACGAVIMVLLAFLLRAVMRLRSDGNTDNRNAIGVSGKVQLTIPPARSGEGKVHLMLQGAYVERGAVTDEAEAIPTGSEVVVVGLSGQTDLVVRRK